MKITLVTSYHNDYLKRLDRIIKKKDSFSKIQDKINYDSYAWADFWKTALVPLGYDVEEIVWNINSIQMAWARENCNSNVTGLSLREITIMRLKSFQPDIIWFNDYDSVLFNEIRDQIRSTRMVIGYSGSAIPKANHVNEIFSGCNLILSCAPETVKDLSLSGHEARHLNHAFDERVLSRLKSNNQTHDLCFIGQILLHVGFHHKRNDILSYLNQNINVEIYSKSISDTSLRQCLLRLRKKLITGKNSIYGLDMYQLLKDTRVAINIHADSSESFVSNMRLFEITGVGTCMLVDWRENISELFEPEKEVITFESREECLDKARWLLKNPETRDKIANAGQKRTLRDHTFINRAKQLDEIIKSYI